MLIKLNMVYTLSFDISRIAEKPGILGKPRNWLLKQKKKKSEKFNNKSKKREFRWKVIKKPRL